MKKFNWIITVLFIFIMSCQSTRESAGNQPRNGNQPNADEIMKQMDANKDGKLSAAEVQGPLKNDFAKIDTNTDGFISKEELNNVP